MQRQHVRDHDIGLRQHACIADADRFHPCLLDRTDAGNRIFDPDAARRVGVQRGGGGEKDVRGRLRRTDARIGDVVEDIGYP